MANEAFAKLLFLWLAKCVIALLGTFRKGDYKLFFQRKSCHRAVNSKITHISLLVFAFMLRLHSNIGGSNHAPVHMMLSVCFHSLPIVWWEPNAAQRKKQKPGSPRKPLLRTTAADRIRQDC